MTREVEELEESPKPEIHIDLRMTTQKKISNGKTSGHDGTHGFWDKKFNSTHDKLALEMNKCIQRPYVPEWLIKGKTTLIQKYPNKGTIQNIYRPITCLSMMLKILTAQIMEDIYNSLTSRGLILKNRKDAAKDPEPQQSYFT